jgi:hypothetical protein
VGSWETTESHLDHLVEMGRLKTVEVNGYSESNHPRTATLSPDA